MSHILLSVTAQLQEIMSDSHRARLFLAKINLAPDHNVVLSSIDFSADTNIYLAVVADVDISNFDSHCTLLVVSLGKLFVNVHCHIYHCGVISL